MNLEFVKDKLLLIIAGIVGVAFTLGFFSVAGEHIMAIFLLFICLIIYQDRKEIKKLKSEIEKLKNTISTNKD